MSVAVFTRVSGKVCGRSCDSVDTDAHVVVLGGESDEFAEAGIVALELPGVAEVAGVPESSGCHNSSDESKGLHSLNCLIVCFLLFSF